MRAGNHRDTMVALAQEKGWRRGVEVGLGGGQLFERFVSLGIEMIGVDLGRRQDRRARVEQIGGRVLWLPSIKAAKHVEDGWADFIFIDAAHSYEAVSADLRAWSSKVRPGGWFGGHDYYEGFPGVIRAVDEFCQVVLHPGYIWERV